MPCAASRRLNAELEEHGERSQEFFFAGFAVFAFDVIIQALFGGPVIAGLRPDTRTAFHLKSGRPVTIDTTIEMNDATRQTMAMIMWSPRSRVMGLRNAEVK